MHRFQTGNVPTDAVDFRSKYFMILMQGFQSRMRVFIACTYHAFDVFATCFILRDSNFDYDKGGNNCTDNYD